MATKTHVDVAERRLRPVYDALDNLNNKQAIKLVDNILRKQKDFHCAKALKALALIRIKREDDAKLILDDICEACTDFDESTLQAMSHCYRETLNPEGVRTIYEKAVKQSPKNEEYCSHLFMACVRMNDYSSQQKAAMNLYKAFPKNPYYFWAVMSIYMQAISSDEEKKQNMYFNLAERMVEKLIKEGKIEGEEEFRLYMMILEKLEKYEELVKLLLGDFKDKLKCYLFEKEEKLVEYYTKLENWVEVNIGCKNLLMKNADNWIYYTKYFDSFFNLLNNGYSPDKPIDTENVQPDYTEELCNTFINSLDEKNKLIRSPSLAKMEFLTRSSKQFNSEINEDSLSDHIFQYFERFGSKPCCFTDLRQFTDILSQQHRTKLIERLKSKLVALDEDAALKEKVNNLYREICIECLCMQLEIYQNLSTTEKFQKAVSYMNTYHKSLKLGSDLNSTEPQYGDTLVVLCAHMLLNLHKEKGDDSMLWHMLLFLEEAVECSQTYAQFKLLLIFLYSNLGAYGAVSNLIGEIDIKYSMYDSLGYFLAHSSYISGQFQATRNIYSSSQGFFISNRKDTPEQIIASYRYGSFRQVTDMINFHSKVEHSYQHYFVRIENLYLDLLQYTNSLNEIKETMEKISSQLQQIDFSKITVTGLSDNRDLNVFDVFKSQNKEIMRKKKEETFPYKVCWLEYRYLVLQCLVSCFESHSNPIQNGETEHNKNDFTVKLEETINKLKNMETNFSWSTVEEPPPCLASLFTQQNHHDVILPLFKTRILLIDNENGDNTGLIKEHLNSINHWVSENLKKLSDGLVIKKNDNCMFNGKSLKYLTCWLETVNFVFIILSSLKEYINTKYSRRGKKKKVNQEIFTQHESILTCMKDILASLVNNVTQLGDDLNEIKCKYIDVQIESETIEELFEKTNASTVTKVWNNLQTSYKQSILEIIQILELKGKFIRSLPR